MTDKNNTEEKFYGNLIITILLGWLGVHKFMQKKPVWGFVYMFSLGLFGFGWIYDIILEIYFLTDGFFTVKRSIKKNADECNELNDHIEELKNSYADIKRIDYGTAEYSDSSRWNYKRPAMAKFQYASNVYQCSRSVLSNARTQPFKYICKYFNIKPNEDTLNQFEQVLNDFSAAEQGKELLKKERDEILDGLHDEIPGIFMALSRDLVAQRLGFKDIDFSQLYFPQYTFRYVSSGGNSSMSASMVFNLENLEGFITYLSQIIKFRKSKAGQRALMTPSLREKIKKRDHYTCCKCKNSTKKEPNLLLEIDHIIPIAKNGLTTEDNLQTLCWKCNRTKGVKVE